MVTLRAQLDRAVRLAEQSSTEVALLRQQLLQESIDNRTSAGSRKRKQPSFSDAEIDPASLLDQPFTRKQAAQHLDQCFMSWRSGGRWRHYWLGVHQCGADAVHPSSTTS